jgi:hypothetical protein
VKTVHGLKGPLEIDLPMRILVSSGQAVKVPGDTEAIKLATDRIIELEEELILVYRRGHRGYLEDRHDIHPGRSSPIM